MKDFWPELFKKTAFGMATVLGDQGLKMAAW